MSDFVGQRPFSASPARLPMLNLENTVGGPEPQYWGITLPLRLESILPTFEELYHNFSQGKAVLTIAMIKNFWTNNFFYRV